MIWGGTLENCCAMSDQNSVVEHQIRPEQLQEELGIGKDAYYSYLKHLKLKAQKDSEGKAYLEPEQANLVRLLREHVAGGGKIAEFVISGSLAVVDGGSLAADQSGPFPSEPFTQEPAGGFDMEALMREAAELAAHRMAYADHVKLQLASQMTYEDLPDDIRAKVDAVREAAVPSAQPGKIAANLLDQWRQRRQGPDQSQIQVA